MKIIRIVGALTVLAGFVVQGCSSGRGLQSIIVRDVYSGAPVESVLVTVSRENRESWWKKSKTTTLTDMHGVATYSPIKYKSERGGMQFEKNGYRGIGTSMNLWGRLGEPKEILLTPIVEPPGHVIDRADQYVLSRVGSDLFEAMYSRISVDQMSRGDWLVQYRVEPMAGHYYFALVHVPWREEAKPTSKYGVPDCAQSPDLCGPFITVTRAKEIAREHGLVATIEPLTVGFYAEGDRFIWYVAAKRKRAQKFDTSERLLIDAVTGEVLGPPKMVSVGCFE